MSKTEESSQPQHEGESSEDVLTEPHPGWRLQGCGDHVGSVPLQDGVHLLECQTRHGVRQQPVEQVVQADLVVVNADLLPEYLNVEHLRQFAGLADTPRHRHPSDGLDLPGRRPVVVLQLLPHRQPVGVPLVPALQHLLVHHHLALFSGAAGHTIYHLKFPYNNISIIVVGLILFSYCKP